MKTHLLHVPEARGSAPSNCSLPEEYYYTQLEWTQFVSFVTSRIQNPRGPERKTITYEALKCA